MNDSMNEIKSSLNMIHFWVNALTDEALNDPNRIKEIRKQINAISRQLTVKIKSKERLIERL